MKLSDNLTYIKGLGPRRVQTLNDAGLSTVRDILNIVPRKYLTHEFALPIKEIRENQYVTLVGKVISAGIQFGKKRRFSLTMSDGSGVVKGLWFNYLNNIKNKVKIGQTITLTGTVGYYSGFQMIHPTVEILSESSDFTHDSFILPIYSIPERLREINFTSTTLQKLVSKILEFIVITDKDEILPNHILKKRHFPAIMEAFRETHFPSNLEQANLALQRFKYQELLHLQLYLQLKKAFNHTINYGIRFTKVGEHFKKLHAALPFQLTSAQERVLKEVHADMKHSICMNRMLQGDVGSGKTVVALLAMAIAADNQYQSAFMAPTEILAEQHYLSLSKLIKDSSLKVVLLTGSLKPQQRKERLALIGNGMVDIVIGTHAIIQKSVKFSRLGLVIIDEQHRFGVLQRAQIAEKGEQPDILVMTATPIPRTMALTVYGDLDLSIINERPKGRLEVKTGWRHDKDDEKINSFIREQVANGHQVYIVFPLVEESEKIDLKSATDSFKRLKSEVFPDLRIGLLHGKLKSDEKERVMTQFKLHELDILVATTVIEVGVDVPNATVMIIEHAERFGLSQLHQLRGRVGRSNIQSYCILKTPKNVSSDAGTRMNVMCQTNDGFKIAEEDLYLRGVGQIFGTRQSGFSDLEVANLLTDQHLLLDAKADAEEILRIDPQLTMPEHQQLKRIIQKEMQEKYGYINIS